MKYNFDEPVNRRGTSCLKYDFAAERGLPEDVLPLWIADMDFKTAPAITDRLVEVAKSGVYGYSDAKEGYCEAVGSWYEKYFNWKIQPEWLVRTPGVVFALSAAIRAFTGKGDAILIQQPVYYPFSSMIQENERIIVNSPLKLENGHYEIDFEDFEKKITDHQVKLFLLCSPHNPVGRVWKEEELRRMADICLKHGVTIVSDEIHNDFTYKGHTHHVLASLDPRYLDITVTCTAPSKTFNLAGLQVSNIFIPNSELRRAYVQAIASTGQHSVNLMGLMACETAYKEGREWLEQLKEYLQGNLDFVRNYLKENLPQIHLIEPEGTYLIWLDFRELGLTEEAREELIIQKAHLWLDSGAIFGVDGEGFERVNIACQRQTLKQALDQLKEAIDKING